MYGDSVIVNYVGDLSKKRALAEAVYLLDRPSNVIIVDHSKPVDTTKTKLLTKPSDPEKKENARRMLRDFEKLQKR
jgi:hypothetical protein